MATKKKRQSSQSKKRKASRKVIAKKRKKSNPRIETPKQKPKPKPKKRTSAQRAEAARLGWERKREREAIQQEAAATAKSKTLTHDEMVVRIKQLEEEAEFLRAQATFVPTRPKDFLRQDGTLAVQPSALRHIDQADDLYKALHKARRKSKIELDRLAHEMADFYDVDIREVYTLFYSP